MKNFLQTRLWVILIAMPIMVHAERIYTPHTFHTMNKVTELIFSGSNTIGRTELLTYKCTGTVDTKFGKDHVFNTYISIRLPKNGSTVTTSQINELDEFTIGVLPADESRRNILVKVSTDSISWGDPLSSEDVIQYSNGSIHVSLPRNNYYVRIYNTNGAKEASITSIYWYQDHCNCFIYEAE